MVEIVTRARGRLLIAAIGVVGVIPGAAWTIEEHQIVSEDLPGCPVELRLDSRIRASGKGDEAELKVVMRNRGSRKVARAELRWVGHAADHAASFDQPVVFEPKRPLRAGGVLAQKIAAPGIETPPDHVVVTIRRVVLVGAPDWVPPPPAASRSAIRGGAEAGDGPDQFRLGMMYAEGRGVVQDDVTAYAWIHLSRAREHPSAPGRLAWLSRRMSAEEISAAQALARHWGLIYFVDEVGHLGEDAEP